MKNMKKKVLIASFFAILMLMTPFTAVTGSIDYDVEIAEDVSTYPLKLTIDEKNLLQEILDRILNGEMELTEDQIITLTGIAVKLDYEAIELTEDEISLLQEVLDRIFNGEMELTEDQIRILEETLNNLIYAKEQYLSWDQKTQLTYILGITDRKMPLTEDEIKELEDIVDSIDDEESKALAQELVDQLITDKGELDLDEVEDLLYNDQGYEPTGFTSREWKWLNKIKDWVERLLFTTLPKIIKWFRENFIEGRGGWMGVTIEYLDNATTILKGVKDVVDAIKADLEIIRDFVSMFITLFLYKDEEARDAFWRVKLWRAFKMARAAAREIRDIFNNSAELVIYPLWSLCNQTIDYVEWLFPDWFSEEYTEADRPYNQPIYISVKILGIDPSYIKIRCDDEYWYPYLNPETHHNILSLKIEYTTIDKDYPFWYHYTKLQVFNTSTEGIITYLPDKAFSNADYSVTLDFSGKPNKPNGSTELMQFNKTEYYTFAIAPYSEDIYYQWDWGGYVGLWDLSPRQSGVFTERVHIWLKKGIHEVRVRSAIDKDDSSTYSAWSEPLIVNVTGLFDGINIQSNPQISSQSISQQQTPSVQQSSQSYPTGQSGVR